MHQEDALFDDIRSLSDEADDLGLTDVALVLEFALDVYLKERELTRDAVHTLPKPDLLERSAQRIEQRAKTAPHHLPRLSFSMTTFPLARVMREAS